VVQEFHENPRDGINWRRSASWCSDYRVRWFPESDLEAGEPMYQVFCLRDTPPTTYEEQEKCLSSRSECWRIVEARRAGQSDIPISSIKRRRTTQRAYSPSGAQA